MNEDALNMSVRKFLKKWASPRSGRSRTRCAPPSAADDSRADEVLPAKVKLTVGGIDLSVDIEGAVELE